MTVKALLALCLCVIAVSAFAQREGMSLQTGLTLQSREELEQAIGSAPQAVALVAGAIAAQASSLAGSAKDPQEVNVIAPQLPAAWLPSVNGVAFRRVEWYAARRGWESHCLRLFWIAAKVEGAALTITVAEGNKCHRSGSEYRFLRTAAGWRSANNSSGSGFAMTGHPCGCR